MKKIGIVMMFVLALSCLQTVMPPTPEAEAASSSSLKVTIVSPSNRTHNSRFLTLNVTVYWLLAGINHMLYTIDKQETCEFSGKILQTEPFSPLHGTIIGVAALPELCEGPHKITVRIVGMVNNPFDIQTNATTYFTIDTTPPSVSSLSIQNETYTQHSLPLDFSTDEDTSWMGYSLDNEANKTLTENATLETKTGVHSLVLYANDTAGNMGVSRTIYFRVIEPFPTTLVVTSVIVVAIAVTSLMVHLKKRHS